MNTIEYIDRIILNGFCGSLQCSTCPLSVYCDSINNKGEDVLSTDNILTFATKIRNNNYDVELTYFEYFL